jgi:hypothetical protein
MELPWNEGLAQARRFRNRGAGAWSRSLVRGSAVSGIGAHSVDARLAWEVGGCASHFQEFPCICGFGVCVLRVWGGFFPADSACGFGKPLGTGVFICGGGLGVFPTHPAGKVFRLE